MVFNSRHWLRNLFQQFSLRSIQFRSSIRRSNPQRTRMRTAALERLEDRALPSAVPGISIGDASITEGDSGTSYLVFTLTRTGDTSPAISVSYTTASDTAAGGSDFTPASDVVTFASGQTTATIAIPITGDLLVEGNENFFVNLTGISDSQGPTASFAARQDTYLGSGVRAVSVGDLNGDGKPDVAVVVPFTSKLAVFLNTTATGSSTVTFSPRTDFDTGSKPYSVKIGDLNGDGKPDITTTNFAVHTVSVLLNTTPTGGSTPTFAIRQDLPTLPNPYYVSIADINGDGLPDLVVAEQGAGGVSVLLNQTAPGAPTASFSSGFNFDTDDAMNVNPDCVSVGDVNGDGKPDLVVANNYASTIGVLLNSTVTGSSTPTFHPFQEFSFFDRNFSTALGDINADGKLDVVVTNRDGNSVSVLINTTPTGATTFSFGGRIDYTMDQSPRSVALEDLNGDGLLDMTVTNQNSLSVLINRTVPGAASSSFATRQDRAIGYGASHVVTADINGDGKPDLVDANLGSSTVSIFLNTFASPPATVVLSDPQNYLSGDTASSVAVGDFNGDGKPDLAVPDPTNGVVSVLFNQSLPGSGASDFGTPQNFSTDTGPFAVAVSDFNGDGKLDLVVTSDVSNTISVLFNTTTPGSATASFSTAEVFTTGAGPRSVAVGDLNGDGKAEIVVGNNLTNTISVFFNTTAAGAATPSFATRQDFTTGNLPRGVSLRDLNGDGRLDIATANAGSNSISVLLNTTAPASGTFSFSTNQEFGVGQLPKSVSIADINGDGRPDLAATSSIDNIVSVLLNTTAPGATVPTYSTRQDFTLGIGANPDSVAFGDYNGDGKSDLAVTSSGLGKLSLLINNTSPGATTPTFAAKQDFSAGSIPGGLAVRDLNGDGKLDFVVANGGTTGVTVVMHATSLISDSQAMGTIQNNDIGPSAILDLNGSNDVGSGFVAGFVENGAAVNIADSDATIVDAGVTELVNLKLVVGTAPDGASEVLTVAGVVIPLNVDTTGTGIVGGTAFHVAYTASTSTVTVTNNVGGTAPIGDFQALLRAVTYLNLSDAPNVTSRTISVTADDGVNPSPPVTSTITVTPANDTPTGIALLTATIDENRPAGTAVGTFTTTDPDPGNTFTYTLVSGAGSTDNSSFTIVNGQLLTTTSFDFEIRNSYEIRVRSTDQDGLSVEDQFLVSVTDVNESPTALDLSANVVAENSDSGTVVGNFSSVDPDTGNTFTYELVSGIGSTDNSRFTIVNGQLQTAASFNFEEASSYSIRVRTTDQDGLQLENQFSITVTNVNETPTNVGLTSGTIAENQAVGSIVGTFNTSDPDAGNTFSYLLAGGDGSTDNSSFTIVNGQLQAAASFDFETQNTYSIRVRSTDQNGLSVEQALTITVTDANEAPSDLILSAATIPENLPIGTTIGLLSSTDIDAGSSFTYTLVGGAGDIDNSSFMIQGEALKVNAILNFEAQSSYLVRIRTTDERGLSFERYFTISVTDANDAPVSLTLSGSSIPEDTAPGTIVGTFSSTDVDAGNTFSYSLVNGPGSADNSAFTIVDGKLTTAVGFNFEAKNSFAIRVRSTDQGGLSFEKPLIISVTNINEAPTNISLLPGSIQEGLPIGTVAGVLTPTDPDVGDSFSYALVTGLGSADNSSFVIVNGQLQTTAVFDLETKNSYSIRLRVTDLAGLSFEKQVTINVTNTNDAPTDIALTSATIAENVASGAVIGAFSSTDPDAGNTFTYTLVDGIGSTDNSSFAIVNGQLRSVATFDFEARSSFSIRVRTQDQGGQTFEKQFTISLTNTNEAPTGLALTGSAVPENVSDGIVVGTLTSTDPDAGNTFTYALVPGIGSADNASFSIVNDQLVTAASFDFELKNKYAIRVRTVDQNGLTFEKQFTINVGDVNENPTDLILSGTTLAEDSASGTTIGVFSSSDPDVGGSFAYTLVDGTGAADNSSFVIVNGQLQSAASFDFEARSVYQIRVRSTDQGGLVSEKPFTITVTNVNDAPTISSIVDQNILEDGATDLLNFSVRDVETAASGLSVTVSSSNLTLIPNASITVSGTGANRGVRVTPVANQSGSATITIVVSDGVKSSSTSFVVTVEPVNDAPTMASFGAHTILEDTVSGEYGFTVADIDTASNGLTVTATSSNPTLIPVANIAINGSGAGRSLVITPAANQNGVVTITVTVSDGELTSSQSFKLTVQAVDDATVVTMDSQPLVYSISSKAVTAVDSTVVINDVDTQAGAFAGTSLIVSGHGPKDTLSLLRARGITTKGKNVLFGTTIIGTFSGGKKGFPLTINFNGQATQNAVQTLAQSIGFKATGKATGNRTMQFRFVNPAGANSIPANRQIQVMA